MAASAIHDHLSNCRSALPPELASRRRLCHAVSSL